MMDVALYTVTDFQKITEQMQEERKEYIKLRKFDKM